MSSPRPVARLTTPAELVASLPYSVGFVPTESLVVLCCHEPRGRAGLCLRFDLPAAADEAALAREVAERVRFERATRVVLAIYTSDGDQQGLARRALADAVAAELDDLVMTEAVLVRDGRFWSYLCSRPECCPPEGRLVEAGTTSAAVSLLQAESVLQGRAVLPDREAVVASLAPPGLLAAAAARQRCAACTELLTGSMLEAGVADTRLASLQTWQDVVHRYRTPPATLGDLEAAALAVSLTDVIVRDAVAVLWFRDEQAVTAVLTEVCRRTPQPYDAPACALLAWVTYAGGGGALVGVALERALASDPTYSLARLLVEAASRQLPPLQLRRAIRATGVELGVSPGRAGRAGRSAGGRRGSQPSG